MRQLTCLLAAFVPLIAAGCGETVSAEQRIEKCLQKQPEATKADCEEWETDGELQDSGVHKEHDEM